MTAAVFERQLVQHCAPAIAGIKPASIITFSRKEGEIGERIREMELAYNRKFQENDLKLRILCECPERCLLMVYRPSVLGRHVSRPEIRGILRDEGYGTDTLDEMLDGLAGRIGRSGPCGFPHEIGLFLGYPVEDVVGFMENKGKNCLYSCYWKVYSDVERAKRWCSRWEKVRDRLMKASDSGMSICEMIRAGAAA